MGATMANQKYIISIFTDSGLARLYREHAVDQHIIQSEIKTLVIVASYACDFFTKNLETLPEDFFTCIEEMKEVMESIDLKSLDFERRSLMLQKSKRRVEARTVRQKRQKEV